MINSRFMPFFLGLIVTFFSVRLFSEGKPPSGEYVTQALSGSSSSGSTSSSGNSNSHTSSR